MVPKVTDKGRSFKGAGLYYLHDKKAATAERVAFTHTVNLPTENAEKGLGWMAHTAMRQAEIKRAAGGVAKGRKLAAPVYAYSLSWSPGQQPTKEQMIAAGLETLKRLGLDGHEAVFVAHNDEPHPHLHVIVNRVNPGNGVAAPLSNDHLKLSEWAEEYERAHGKILCEQRVENNARRKKEFVKDRTSQSAAEFHRWRRERQEAEFQRRQREKQDLVRSQGADRKILGDVLKTLANERRAILKDEQKPLWAALYKGQRTEKRKYEDAQKTTFGRLRYWIKNRHLDRWGGDSQDRQGMLARAFNIVVNREIMAKALAAKHEAERKALSEKVRAATAERLATLYGANDKMLDRMKQEHDAARAAQRAQHRAEIDAAARRKERGGDRTSFAFDKVRGDDPLHPQFNKAASPRPAGRQDDAAGARKPPEHAPEKKPPEKTVEDGAAGRTARPPRRRGQDETKGRGDSSRGDDKGDDKGGAGDGGGKLSGAFRDARDGKDPLPREEPAKDAGSEGEGGGQAFSAFRDAQGRKDALPRPEPGKDAGGDGAGGGKAFSAFRDAHDRKGKDRDRDDDGRGRERKPPKPPGEQ